MVENRNGMREREINLIDMVVAILLKWRLLIVLMGLGGILFAGVSYVRSNNAIKEEAAKRQALEIEKEEEVKEMDKEWLEEQLTQTQISNIYTALMYQNIYNEKMEYAEGSVIANIDPFNAPKTDITFWIKTDDLERTYNLQKVYEDMVASAGLLEYVEANCEMNYNPTELIYLERTSYGQWGGQDTVRVYTICDEEKTCKEIAQCVIDYIMQQRELLVETLGEHEVVILDQSYTTIFAKEYLKEQNNLQAEINTYRTNLAKMVDAFTEDEENYYNYLLETDGLVPTQVEDEMNVETEEMKEESVEKPSISLKLTLVGMIGSAFVCVFVVFMSFVANTKIRSNDNLAELYDLPQLGFIPTAKGKKKLLGFVDKWILSLRDHNKRKFTQEEAINMATVAVKMAVKKSSYSEVYFVGCDIKNQTEDICKKMQDVLCKENVQVKILDNVLYDAETMEILENAKCVVLIEKAGSTLYDEIAKELELLTRQDICVLGGIVVE